MTFNTLDFKRELLALQRFSQGACVRVLAVNQTRQALVLESLVPGTELRSSSLTPAQTIAVCCEAACNLHQNQSLGCGPPYADDSFPSVLTLLEGFERD